ncbi:cysteine peptidase family C39 domain-containing protein [Apirhabdus apintestini]|nr:cysteine peptidase family C39 domain-containing protein [Enterobacteriaceae bacterium CA-0114]
MTEGSRARLRRAPGHFSLRRRAPVLHQSEAAECGLACLAMIAGHHGKWVNVQALRQRFGVSSRGSTVETLSQTASEMGFGMRALSLEMHELPQLTLPCILHWDFNHFVVLVQAGRRRAIIHDPASGRRTLTLQELGAHFTGVACELWPGVNFTRTRHVVRLKLQDLLRQMRGFRAAFTRLFYCRC